MPHSILHRVLIALLAFSFLLARVGNAHLHLCFDGAEKPATVHILDVDLHGQDSEHGAAMSAPHHDIDISLVNQALGKTSRLGLDDLPLLAIVVVLFSLLVPVLFRFPLASVHSRPSIAPYLRPPLRGPPTHSLA